GLVGKQEVIRFRTAVILADSFNHMGISACYTSGQLAFCSAWERAIMKHHLLGISFFACILFPYSVFGDELRDNLLFVANQVEHSVLLVDPQSKQVLATVGVDINGHEVAVSPDGRFGYVPIYGNTWVGRPGSNGRTIHVVDLHAGRTVAVIDLGKEV